MPIPYAPSRDPDLRLAERLAALERRVRTRAADPAVPPVSAIDDDLASIAATDPTAGDKMLYTTAAHTWALASLTAFGRALLDDADAAAGRATLAVPSVGESLARYGRGRGQAGHIAPDAPNVGQTSGTPTANRAYYNRFVPSTNLVVNNIAFVVTTAAGANDACDVGIYDASFSRIVSAGATTGKLNAGSGTVQSVSITQTTLTAGTIYYAAFSLGTFGGTAPQILMTSLASSRYMQIFGTADGIVETRFGEAGHALANPATLTAGVTSNSPILALRT